MTIRSRFIAQGALPGGVCVFLPAPLLAFLVSLSEAAAVCVLGLMALGVETLYSAVALLGSPVGVLGVGLILTGAVCLAALAAVMEVVTNG